KMADENVLAPTRSDDQILPFAAWMPIGKSNFVLDLHKKQKNPIFQISNTLTYEAKTGAYSFQLDETRFVLDANLLKDALEIMPIDQAHQFVSPPLGDAIMDFVNQLGYTKEFIQAIQTFLTNKENLGSPTKKGRKDKPHVISYCQFTKLSICHLGRIHNIHQRSTSPFHLVDEDLRLGNLKFVPKGKVDEVFGMSIPNELISNNIRNAPYYNAYLKMVAKHDLKVAAKNERKKKTESAKQPKSMPAIEKSSKPEPAPKPKATKEGPSKASTAKPPKLKHAKEKSTKTIPPQKVSKGKITKVHKARAQSHAHVSGVAIREPVVEATQPLPIVEGKGKAIVTEEQAAHLLLALYTPKKRSTTDQFIFQRRTTSIEESSTRLSAQAQDDTSANIVCDSPSPTDAETGTASKKTNSGGDTEILQIDEEQGKVVDKQVNLEEKTDELDQGQAGSDPDRTLDSRPSPEHSTETISSMKNLEDAYAIGDQFNNDKSTKDETKKPNMEAEVVSMVTVPIYQASSLVPPQVFNLELRDLPYKIDEAVCESVREVVHVALQALLQDRLRELPEDDMKEILHQRMFETGPYKSLPEHVALYEALEASMKHANMDKLLTKMDKSRKR
nr:histone deacetylase 14 [Tanacetum cinerariifolium]